MRHIAQAVFFALRVAPKVTVHDYFYPSTKARPLFCFLFRSMPQCYHVHPGLLLQYQYLMHQTNRQNKRSHGLFCVMYEQWTSLDVLICRDNIILYSNAYPTKLLQKILSPSFFCQRWTNQWNSWSKGNW